MNLVNYIRQGKVDERPRFRMDPATTVLLTTFTSLSGVAAGSKFPNNIMDRALIFYAKAWVENSKDAETAKKFFPILEEIDYLYSEYEDILDLTTPKKKGEV